MVIASLQHNFPVCIYMYCDSFTVAKIMLMNSINAYWRYVSFTAVSGMTRELLCAIRGNTRYFSVSWKVSRCSVRHSPCVILWLWCVNVVVEIRKHLYIWCCFADFNRRFLLGVVISVFLIIIHFLKYLQLIKHKF